MRDIDDRHARLVAQALDIGQDLSLARLVERSERLVHEQEPRLREQRPADRHALLLAARQAARPAFEQVADAEEVDDRVEPGRRHALAAAGEPAPELQVVLDREMREQPPFLEHVADLTAVLRHEHAGVRVEEDDTVDRDPSPLRAHETGDGVDQRRLARSGTAEERRQSSFGAERSLQMERALPMRDVDLQAHSAAILRRTTRAMSSEQSKASIETAIDTSVNRNAPASPPGTCVKV